MEIKHKVLCVDDDPETLDIYRELLSRLPSQPEVHTASSGPRAMAMLEDESFRLLLCDLRMPKMDGLQVLSIVRRKYPQMRTVALTGVQDEQFRARVYALGVDLYWTKPGNEQETKLFLECLESLLGQEVDSGFRGVQSKSLVDIIQLECMSQSSSVLRICNGPLIGKIWILDGEVTDAETGDIRGEAAIQKIFSWQAGTFETLPPEASRPRTVFKSYNALLLECAQVMDESKSEEAAGSSQEPALAGLAQIEGVEFFLAQKSGEKKEQVTRGLENPEKISIWATQSLDRFRALGERLHAGPLEEVECVGPQRQVTLSRQSETEICVGWTNTVSPNKRRELSKKIYSLWVS